MAKGLIDRALRLGEGRQFKEYERRVAAINRVNVQGTTEQQAQQIRTIMAIVFPEAVTLVREARQGLS